MSALYVQSTSVLTVLFDRALLPGAIDPFNWFIRETNLSRPGMAPASVAGSTATVTMAGGLPDAGPDEVTFVPPPFDVVSSFGVAAAAFAGFPLAVVP